jgi:hypothetical protein
MWWSTVLLPKCWWFVDDEYVCLCCSKPDTYPHGDSHGDSHRDSHCDTFSHTDSFGYRDSNCYA